MNSLKRRIIEISYTNQLSHISSCLEAVDIVYSIYKTKKDDERFVLSQGHAGLALYVVLEHFGKGNAEQLLKSGGIHPDRLDCTSFINGEKVYPIDCSTGSLGQGLPIAVGMALADRNKKVYCLISDGECAEGSVWEALRIADENKLDNLIVHMNVNGYSALGETRVKYLPSNMYNWIDVHLTNVDYLPFLQGVEGHYHKLTPKEYQFAMEKLA